ncbi:MAG: phosphopentomutase [Clostridia bacterium]
MKRVILIILDGVGIGALPDAAAFSDEGAHTLFTVLSSEPQLHLETMCSLGLAKISGSRIESSTQVRNGAMFGRAAEQSAGKDTVSGHFEIMGCINKRPFKTFPNGFPRDFLDEFEKKIDTKTLGNEVASGTEIIERLGDKHMQTGFPIVYTSADSVFQIAMHEEIISLKRQYEISKIAREMLIGDMLTCRVIMRPFSGKNGKYMRTANRRDFAIPPPYETVLDALTEKGYKTCAIGKIEDIFSGHGISFSDHTTNNADGIDAILKYMENGNFDFIFANLVDFDMLYGHRNDPHGFALALSYFDEKLKKILNIMTVDDLLIITADHGCDPTPKTTDHTREYIPILTYRKTSEFAVCLPDSPTYADIGASAYKYLTGANFPIGKSFL